MGGADEFALVYKNNALSFYRNIFKLEAFDFSAYNLVISISTGIAQGIVTNLDTKHLNIQLGTNTWLWDCELSFFKKSLRSWQSLSFQRPDQNYVVFEYQKSELRKIARSIMFEKIQLLEKVKLVKKENDKNSNYFVLLTEKNSSFSEEMIAIFNRTGRKLVVFTNEKVRGRFLDKISSEIEIKLFEDSDFDMILNESRGVLFDYSFGDLNLVCKNLKVSKPIFVYRKNFWGEVFESDAVYNVEGVDNLESDFAKFVSWSKKYLPKDCYVNCYKPELIANWNELTNLKNEA